MSKTEDFSIKTNQNTRKLAIWTTAWTLSTALSTFGPTFLWSLQWLSAAAIGLNVILGFAMILANRKLLNDMDELQRKIHMEAMGITLGVALVVGIAYNTMDIVNLISFDAEIAHLIMVLGITYLVTLIINNRKYK